MTKERAILALLAVLLLACVARDQLRPKPDPVAPLRTDQMIAVLQDSGWVVVTAKQAGNLAWKVTDLERDTTTLGRKVRELARQATIAGAQIRALSELHASAADTMLVPAVAHNNAETMPLLSDSLTAAFDDGVFSGRVAYFPRPSQFSVLVQAQIALETAITQGADGRVLFSAVPSDPRVKLALEGAVWSPPPPVRVCTWTQRGRAALVGGGLTELGRVFLLHR